MNYKGTRPKRFGNLITISNQELQDFIKNQTPIVKKGIDLKLSKRDLVDLVKFKQPVQRKGYNIMVEQLNEAPKKSTVEMFKALVKFGGPMKKELMEALKLMVKGYGLEYVKREVKKDPKDFYKNLKHMARAFPEFKSKKVREIVRNTIEGMIEDSRCVDCGHITNEDLRKWFGKGGAGGTTSGGWDRYGSDGQKLGKCGGGKKGGAYAACLSAEKARKLGPKGRAAFVRRKRAAQKKAGDTKKGRQRSKGKKPTYAKTGA